jgi:hypothetical protein
VKHLVVAAVSVLAAGAFVLAPSPAGQEKTIRMDTASFDIPELPRAERLTMPTEAATTAPAAQRAAVRVKDPRDIPDEALAAYQRAAQILDEVSPACDLSWTLLAAVGGVESDHGRHPGSSATAGATPQAPVRVSTAGSEEPIAADGPMQIAPDLWKVVGVDGNGDGVRSVKDIDDSALAAGVYLCAGWKNLDEPKEMAAALAGYRDSDDFVDAVLVYERAYSSVDFPDATELETDAKTALSGSPVLSGTPVPGTGTKAGEEKADKQERKAARDAKKAVKKSKKAAAGWRKPWSSATRDRDDLKGTAKDRPKAKASATNGGTAGKAGDKASPGKPTTSASPKPSGSPAAGGAPSPGKTGSPTPGTGSAKPSPGKQEESQTPGGSTSPSPSPTCQPESTGTAPSSPTGSASTGTSGPASNPADESSASGTGSPTGSASPSSSGSPSSSAGVSEGVKDEQVDATPGTSPSACGTPGS